MNYIGIAELRTKTSEILRNVRKLRRHYFITYHRRPIAVLSPLKTDALLQPVPNEDQVWDHIEKLGEKIGQSWRTSPKQR